MDTLSNRSKAPTYGLTMKVGYKLADVAVYEKGGEPFGLSPHGSGACHHNHDSS